jgi:hypothetical protein
MPATDTIAAPRAKSFRYAVFVRDHVEHGTAEEILRGITEYAARNGGTKDVNEFARVLVDEADYHLPAGVWEYLEQVAYPTLFDRALDYLSRMEYGGVEILTKELA